MASKKGSLLSKFSSFVREMGNSAGDPDDDDSDLPASAKSDAARQQRKRQDDAIRSQEFTQLRKMISQQRPAQATPGGSAPRPSGVAMPGRPKAGTDSAHSGLPATADPNAASWWGSAAPQDNSKSLAITVTEDMDLDFTDLLAEPQAPNQEAPAERTPKSAPTPLPAKAPARELTLDDPLFLDAEPLTADPVEARLREAAMGFSRGDYAAAEGDLLAALDTKTLDSAAIEMLTFALFDIYRATGQQDRFEAAALDYAQRNGRSPAEWFSLPEQLAALEQQNQVAAVATPAPAAGAASSWSCPARLDTVSLVALQKVTAESKQISNIDWSGLRTIENSTGPALAKLIRAWCTTPTRLQWRGTDVLQQALALHTQQAAEREDELWWRIHMDVLCILRLTEPFENLALDYCVAFEVSPPNWEDVRCTLAQDGATGDTEAPARAPAPAVVQSAAPASSNPDQCSLRGDLLGANHPGLVPLQSMRAGVPVVTVACGLLRRIDMEAAQAIVDWARKTSARGTHIHFVQIPRLALIIMLMLELDQYANLATRAN